MKLSRVLKTALAVLALAPALAWSAPGPAGGLAATAHDFTASPTMTAAAGGAIGLCTYCHTPHQAITTSLLWNHKATANTFTWDDATTTGGTTYATIAPAYKGPTVKCLSCHDGSVAIGDVALFRETAGVMDTFKVGDDPLMPMTKIGAGGAMKGNHPVGMPYVQAAANTYNAVTTGAAVPVGDFVANPVGTNATFIKLYNDVGGLISGGASAGKTGIECSSCHDPHNKSTADDLFLRAKISGATNASGYICLQCHIK